MGRSCWVHSCRVSKLHAYRSILLLKTVKMPCQTCCPGIQEGKGFVSRRHQHFNQAAQAAEALLNEGGAASLVHLQSLLEALRELQNRPDHEARVRVPVLLG